MSQLWLITKHHRLSDLAEVYSSQSRRLGSQGPRCKALVDSFRWFLACGWLPSHGVLTRVLGEGSPLRRALLPSRGPTLMTSSEPYYLPKATSPNTTLWPQASNMNWWAHNSAQSMSVNFTWPNILTKGINFYKRILTWSPARWFLISTKCP